MEVERHICNKYVYWCVEGVSSIWPHKALHLVQSNAVGYLTVTLSLLFQHLHLHHHSVTAFTKSTFSNPSALNEHHLHFCASTSNLFFFFRTYQIPPVCFSFFFFFCIVYKHDCCEQWIIKLHPFTKSQMGSSSVSVSECWSLASNVCVH